MLKQRPTLDIARPNRYQVPTQVDEVRPHFSQSASNTIVERYDLHRFKSDTECFELIDALLADNKYLFNVAEHVEGGVRGPIQCKVSRASNKRPVSTFFPGGSNPTGYLHQILSSGE
jgi:hypothetical protein